MMIRALTAAAILGLATPARAQPFTYQGRLADSNLPANGSYDIQLVVYPVATGGAQIGATTTVLNHPITDGLFTVQVNPGNLVFDGSARWLEVRVRPAGGGAYTTLVPRQEITPTPYATRALHEWLVPVEFDTLRTDPARTKLFLNRDTAFTAGEYFGITTPTGFEQPGGMNINTQSAGGLPFYAYSTNGTTKAFTYLQGTNSTWHLWVNGENRLAVTQTGNVGIGTVSPSEKLQVAGGVQASNFTYASPAVRYYSITPAAFQPRASYDEAVIEGSVGLTYFNAPVTSQNFFAPVHLPHGANITGLTVWFIDNSTNVDLSASLLQRNFGASAFLTLGSVSSIGNSPTVQERSTSVSHVVNNSSGVYLLSVFCIDWEGAATAIKGARITYTVSAPD